MHKKFQIVLLSAYYDAQYDSLPHLSHYI